ncbi:MAG: hypothetical protein PHE77_02020, partial [Candidatus Pacebacteria bacterium]|nr:hypothetical protein [Candidatus Paceibacterota bacterium]
MFTLEPELLVAFLVDLGFFFAASIFLLIWLISSRKEVKRLRMENLSTSNALKEIKDQIQKIAESQRLSVILKLEPSSLKID